MVNKPTVESIKKMFPRGTRIVLDKMEDPRPIPPGTKGTVDHVDDIGTIHCRFDDGRGLGILFEEDEFHKLETSSEYSVTEIQYELSVEEDFDGDADAAQEVLVSLPKQMTVQLDVELNDDIEERIADAISDKTGWLVKSFSYELK